MKINDQQFGRPQILYKATKAQIEATPNPQPGMIAFATDTNQIGIYTGGGWQWGTGGGDMLKAIYDTDNDGVVDAAESVDWDGVQNKPSTYPPSSHNHDDRYYTEDELNTSGGGGQVHWNNVTTKPSTYPPSAHQHAASDTTSGVFDPARIPNLDASKITSGTLSTDRFSAYSDLQAESRIGMGIGLMPTGTELRRALNQSSDITEDFTGSSMPSGWSWAGSPFVTPPTVDYAVVGTLLRARSYTSAFRSFLFKSAPNLYAYSILCGFEVGTQTGAYAGVRLDDGTDNNYVEVVWWNVWSASEPNIRVYLRQRTGGGAVVETEMTNMRQTMPLTFTRLTVVANGTRWSSWQPGVRLDNQYFRLSGYSTGSTVSWTPSRAGVIFGAPSAQDWMVWGVDAVAF
jgi:hypothetical protein